jgi:hypothetical protein
MSPQESQEFSYFPKRRELSNPVKATVALVAEKGETIVIIS